MELSEYEQLSPVAKFKWGEKVIRFSTPTMPALWRVQTILTKEPWTIDWLCNIKAGEILIDVGANIGIYAMFAAVCQGAHVVAFEPESQNFALLCKNIYENDLNERVTAYCLGCSDQNGFDNLYLSEFKAASSCHSIGEDVGFDLKPRKSLFAQGSYHISLDDAIASGSIPPPNYIKIDVDGFEHLVIAGAHKTLADPNLKSIIIELNPSLAQHNQVVQTLTSLGFCYDPEQVRESARDSGTFQGVGEWIFRRRLTTNAYNEEITPEFIGSPLSIPPISENATEVMDHVLKRISKTQIVRDPFPIAVIDNIFPSAYYKLILQNFPTSQMLAPLASSGRVTGGAYEDRHVALFTDEDFSRLGETQQEFWREFAGWLYNPIFLTGVMRYFGRYVNKRLWRLSHQTGKIPTVRSDALLVDDHASYSIGPHTDAPHRLISFLFYMPTDNSKRHLGTSLYTPKKPGFICEGSRHHEHTDFELIKTIEFLPNRLVMFPKTNKSFHGVEEIKDDSPERRLLINNIRII